MRSSAVATRAPTVPPTKIPIMIRPTVEMPLGTVEPINAFITK